MPAPLATIPDWKGVDENTAANVLTQVAAMHAKYWRCASNGKVPPALDFVYYGECGAARARVCPVCTFNGVSTLAWSLQALAFHGSGSWSCG